MAKKQQPKQPIQTKITASHPSTVESNTTKKKMPFLWIGLGVAILLVILTIVYNKSVLSGMSLSTHDTNQYNAMSKVGHDYLSQNGEYLTWNNRMFSGMPNYLIGGFGFSKVYEYLPASFMLKVLRTIPSPAYEMFILCFWAFISFLIFTRKNIGLSLLGGLAVGFCTANIVSLDAGHMTKVCAIAYILPMFSGIYLISKERYAFGSIMFIVFLFLELNSGHVQISYYALILLFIYILYLTIEFIREKKFKELGVSALLIATAFIINLLLSSNYFFINDFSKDTTRGADILNAAKMNPGEPTSSEKKADLKEKGVGFDYATQWSLGYEELATTIVPNFTGGSSGGSLDENSNVYKAVAAKAPQYAAQFVQQLPLYWGSEPFVQGPIYLGAIIFFLFVFGMFAYKGKLKWWIFGGIVLTVLIALGKNFAAFYHLLYNMVPMFNKFRAPTMILAITQTLMVLIGVLGLMEFFNKNTTKDDRIKTLKYATGIAGGILVCFILFGSLFSFRSKNIESGKSADEQFKAQLVKMSGGDETFANEVVSALVKDRASLMRKDAIRSLLFVLIAAGLLFAFATTTFQNKYVYLGALSFLVLMDYWGINKRYLNENDFEETALVENNAFPLTPADQTILSENKDGARMVDLTVDVFNSASPAYFHRTIGGYNPAKLRRYQDVIEYGISHDFGLLNKGGFANANFINMLNTKYLKQGNEANQIITNPFALGNAWFVNAIEKVSTPEDEILKVRDINPARTAIVNTEFDNILSKANPSSDSTPMNANRFIRLSDSKSPMKFAYTFKSPNPEFAVFSEVIYRPNEDWVAYIDGKEAKHVRVNYILRGMQIPEGNHTITFEFKPKKLANAKLMLLIGNILFYAFIAAMLFWWWKKKNELIVKES